MIKILYEIIWICADCVEVEDVPQLYAKQYQMKYIPREIYDTMAIDLERPHINLTWTRNETKNTIHPTPNEINIFPTR